MRAKTEHYYIKILRISKRERERERERSWDYGITLYIDKFYPWFYNNHMLKPITKAILQEWNLFRYELLFVLFWMVLIFILRQIVKVKNGNIVFFIITTIIFVTLLTTLIGGFISKPPKIYWINLIIFILITALYVSTRYKTEPSKLEYLISINIITGKGIYNFPSQKPEYPLITNEGSIAYDKTPRTEANFKRYGSDLFIYLFLKWMNSIYANGWYLKYETPLIHASFRTLPEAIKNINNSNVLRFDDLPADIKENNIFFKNEQLFSSGKFNTRYTFTLFRNEHFSINLPPETTMTVLPNLIRLNNNFCSIEFKINMGGSGIGFPLDYHIKPFSKEAFEKVRFFDYVIGYKCEFKSTLKTEETKKYKWWANTILNYFRAYFDWERFKSLTK